MTPDLKSDREHRRGFHPTARPARAGPGRRARRGRGSALSSGLLSAGTRRTRTCPPRAPTPTCTGTGGRRRRRGGTRASPRTRGERRARAAPSPPARSPWGVPGGLAASPSPRVRPRKASDLSVSRGNLCGREAGTTGVTCPSVARVRGPLGITSTDAAPSGQGVGTRSADARGAWARGQHRPPRGLGAGGQAPGLGRPSNLPREGPRLCVETVFVRNIFAAHSLWEPPGASILSLSSVTAAAPAEQRPPGSGPGSCPPHTASFLGRRAALSAGGAESLPPPPGSLQASSSLGAAQLGEEGVLSEQGGQQALVSKLQPAACLRVA